MAEADPRIEATTTPEPVAVKPKRNLLRPILMFGVPLVIIMVVTLSAALVFTYGL